MRPIVVNIRVAACATMSKEGRLGVVQVSDETLLVTVDQACRMLGVKSRNTLWQWEKAGHGPKPLAISPANAKRRSIRYRVSDILSFIGGNHE